MTIIIGLVVDASVLMLLFRGLAGARVPWPQLWRGALLGAVGTGALRYLGASVVANVSDNPLLASAGAVATLLLWLNIAARVTLMAAAWTADPPAPPKLTKDMLQHQDQSPNYVSVSAPETLEWEYGAYTGLVQPLPAANDAYAATEAAAEAHPRRARTGGRIQRLQQARAPQDQPAPRAHGRADHADQGVPRPREPARWSHLPGRGCRRRNAPGTSRAAAARARDPGQPTGQAQGEVGAAPA